MTRLLFSFLIPFISLPIVSYDLSFVALFWLPHFFFDLLLSRHSSFSGMPDPPTFQAAALPPYTQLLSTLRKINLLRLCLEFHLPNDGSVLQLRDHLRDYLNLNRDTLVHNPRYTALFPRHHRVNQPPPPRTKHSTDLSYFSSRSSSPDDSKSSDHSFESWHGIKAHDDVPHIHINEPLQHPVQHSYPHP